MDVLVPRYLPAAIVRAQTFVQQKGSLEDLDRSGKISLLTILSYVQADRPGHGVWPSRESLAERAGVYSERTIYRGLATLERAGYIERTRRRVRGGRFTSGLIKLTQRAVNLLHLDLPVEHAPPTANLSRVCIEPTKDRNSLQKEPVASIEARRLRLPEDLVHLTHKGVTPKGVSALMRLAKTKGQRLQDVVTVSSKYLDRLKPGEAYPYLQACLAQDRDYTGLAKKARQERAKESITESAKRWVEHLLGRFDGAELWNTRTGDRIGVVRARDCVVEGEGRYLPINGRMGAALAEGVLSLKVSSRNSQ